MVDSRVAALLPEVAVHDVSPSRSPFLRFGTLVPINGRDFSIALVAGFLPPGSIYFYWAQGQHNVGVRVRSVRVMDAEVGAHSGADEGIFYEFLREGDVLIPRQFAWKGELYLPRQLRGFVTFSHFDGIPEDGAVGVFGGRVL